MLNSKCLDSSELILYKPYQCAKMIISDLFIGPIHFFVCMVECT